MVRLKLDYRIVLFFATIFTFTGCGDKGNDLDYETTPNGLKYYFFHENKAGKAGNVGDIYTFNASFYNDADSLYLQKEVHFKSSYTSFRGDFMEGLLMLREGDSAVFNLAADSFYQGIGQTIPEFFKPGDRLKLRVGLISILNDFTFQIEMLEKQIRKINTFVSRKDWKVNLDSVSGIRYEITQTNPSGTPVEIGDTVSLKNYFWYTIEEKIIAKGTDRDDWTLVVGDSSLQSVGVSRALTFLKQGESARIILPYDQAFGEEGNFWVPGFTTICLELTVATVRKKTVEE